ncbi:hypothetical protein TNIN_273661 [Trichonephila inaurata madagascariensis]|uniref:Uncharacterized protein n=1 Tax=Trichonephila inaurata madagascariensis TaxID=2747483 RepID=A0A8X6YI63_9ARAC|nr:hypothetical protein TNIN_273661 [Trichonephila inaurata madagascariensis]
MLCESGLCHSFLKPSKPITASDYIDKWVPQMRFLAPIQANAVESKTGCEWSLQRGLEHEWALVWAGESKDSYKDRRPSDTAVRVRT